MKVHSNNTNENQDCRELIKNVDYLISDTHVKVRNHWLATASKKCIVRFVELAVLETRVSSVCVRTEPVLQNFEARGIIQSGQESIEPYTTAGLNGTGQIIGVADSGLNDLSCFFFDDSGVYSTTNTDRIGTLQPHRRKVIKYSTSPDFADPYDDEGTLLFAHKIYSK